MGAGLLRKRSLNLAGHATSLALEPAFWAALEAMAAERGLSLAGLIGEVDEARREHPLASACRVAALNWARRVGGVELNASSIPAASAPV